MKFSTIGHFTNNKKLNIPKEWIIKDLIVSPEIAIKGLKGHIIGLQLTPMQLMSLPKKSIRKKILDAVIFAQTELNVNLIQLGALTTSVTSGGEWLVQQEKYHGYVNHGDSYTAAITCQAVEIILNKLGIKSSDQNLAIVGAYGIIGEAVSKILVPKFNNTLLIGPKNEKLTKLSLDIKGNFDISTDLETNSSDVIITSTNHPKSLLESKNLKKNAIIIDVSQPPNVSKKLCEKRKDIIRVDGGYVDFPIKYHIPLPDVPSRKLFACIVEVIMQGLENDKNNHVGSIDINYLRKTEYLGKKYGFMLNELTNFGEKIELKMENNIIKGCL